MQQFTFWLFPVTIPLCDRQTRMTCQKNRWHGFALHIFRKLRELWVNFRTASLTGAFSGNCERAVLQEGRISPGSATMTRRKKTSKKENTKSYHCGSLVIPYLKLAMWHQLSVRQTASNMWLCDYFKSNCFTVAPGRFNNQTDLIFHWQTKKELVINSIRAESKKFVVKEGSSYFTWRMTCEMKIATNLWVFKGTGTRGNEIELVKRNMAGKNFSRKEVLHWVAMNKLCL